MFSSLPVFRSHTLIVLSRDPDTILLLYLKCMPAVHGLRKFCITQMAKAKVDREIAKLLTGHSIGVRGRYLKYSEEDLLQEYLKAVDLLTINETNRLRKKVDIMKEKEYEIQSLKKQLATYDDMMIQLKHEVDKLKQMMNDSVKEKKKLAAAIVISCRLIFLGSIPT